jgi:hypothetical protein
MKVMLLLMLLIGTSRLSIAQQSAYQDADGNSSIYFLAGGANLSFNVSSTKFSVGVLHMPDGQSPTLQWKERGIYGINFSGKPSTDLANQIFQSGNSPASIGGGGVLGLHRLFAPLGKNQNDNTVFTDDWFLVNVGYSKSTFNTVPSNSTSLTAQHFDGFSLMPTYNCSFSLPGLTMIFGASAGVSRVNNAAQLSKVSISTTESQTGNVSVVQSKDAYLGTYREGYNVPVHSDFVFVPTKLEWVSFDAFERSNVLTTGGYAEGGVGIFIAQPAKPTKVLGGISVAWKDGDRTIGIVGGWSF